MRSLATVLPLGVAAAACARAGCPLDNTLEIPCPDSDSIKTVKAPTANFRLTRNISVLNGDRRSRLLKRQSWKMQNSYRQEFMVVQLVH